MSQWIGAGFIVLGFVILFRAFRLAEKSRDAVSEARRSIAVIRNARLDDKAKETALQQNAKQLFKLFCSLTFGGAIAFLLPTGLVWLADRLGVVSLRSVFDTALSPLFLTASSIAVFCVLYAAPRIKSKKPDYGFWDRLLYRIAFRTYASQIGVSDIEDCVYAKHLAPIGIDRPVFITGLPRAGTTMLLEYCEHMPEFACHCYRDMPFILTPCLWNRFSSIFNREAGQLRERAHGDGMLINEDSPEAFEEVVWKAFWRGHYLKDRIIPWQNQGHKEFEEFFRRHIRKIIFLRRKDHATMPRYISKNNGNIARIRMLKHIFPDSIIIVPFRHPLHHAASLLEQHRNFLRIHEKDKFASDYMKAIGHFDFGHNLRPIDFAGWIDKCGPPSAETLTFWLEYWVACYGYLLREEPRTQHFFHYEGLCESPDKGLKILADIMGTRYPETLVTAAAAIRRARTRRADTGTLSAPVIREAEELYFELKKRASNG